MTWLAGQCVSPGTANLPVLYHITNLKYNAMVEMYYSLQLQEIDPSRVLTEYRQRWVSVVRTRGVFACASLYVDRDDSFQLNEVFIYRLLWEARKQRYASDLKQTDVHRLGRLRFQHRRKFIIRYDKHHIGMLFRDSRYLNINQSTSPGKYSSNSFRQET